MSTKKIVKIESKHIIKAFCHLFYQEKKLYLVYKTFQLHQMLASTTASDPTSQSYGLYCNKQA